MWEDRGNPEDQAYHAMRQFSDLLSLEKSLIFPEGTKFAGRVKFPYNHCVVFPNISRTDEKLALITDRVKASLTLFKEDIQINPNNPSDCLKFKQVLARTRLHAYSFDPLNANEIALLKKRIWPASSASESRPHTRASNWQKNYPPRTGHQSAPRWTPSTPRMLTIALKSFRSPKAIIISSILFFIFVPPILSFISSAFSILFHAPEKNAANTASSAPVIPATHPRAMSHKKSTSPALPLQQKESPKQPEPALPPAPNNPEKTETGSSNDSSMLMAVFERTRFSVSSCENHAGKLLCRMKIRELDKNTQQPVTVQHPNSGISSVEDEKHVLYYSSRATYLAAQPTSQANHLSDTSNNYMEIEFHNVPATMKEIYRLNLAGRVNNDSFTLHFTHIPVQILQN